MRLRPQKEFETAMILMETGRGDSEIARLTGIPRATVNAWRRCRGSQYHQRVAAATAAWRPRNSRAYCYLLGTYLGDGCIHVAPGGSASLVVSLDSRYPAIVDEVEAAMGNLLPDVPVRRCPRKGRSVTLVRVSHPVLPFAFPQHGPGHKHTREIVLSAWQRELTAASPEELLRGLIHSDGCRVINRFKTRLRSGRLAEYAYPRYFFSNLSSDIRGIFCEHCDLLGIRWTQSNPWSTSVSHRKSVALLDDFVGPKA